MHYVLLDDLPHQPRAIVRLSGPDTRRFVQGTITADVASITAEAAVVGALCTVKGKLVSELVVLAVGDEALDLLVPDDTADVVAESLSRHIVMDDVHVAPPVRPCVAIAWAVDGAPALAIAAEGVRTYRTSHPGPGTLVVGPRAAVLAALASGIAVDASQWALRRIHSGTPAWGHEIEADTFPPEVGFVHAVSYDKGCFMGQEPLARIHARGQVNRVMVRFSATRMPNEDTLALFDGELNRVGRMTTTAVEGDAVVGLAIVRRAAAIEGTPLTSGEVEVTVTSGPLGDDQGVSTRQKTATVKLGRR